ncbi:hypothetical protein GC167_05920 [bacterium]|nr:hypothetical protein [bacterium]
MNLNDVGQWAISFIVRKGLGTETAWCFFHSRPCAITFANNVGGELFVRMQDGTLKKADR